MAGLAGTEGRSAGHPNHGLVDNAQLTFNLGHPVGAGHGGGGATQLRYALIHGGSLKEEVS